MNKKDEVAVTSRSFSKNKTLVDELRNRYEKVTLNTEGKSLSGQSLIDFLKGANKVIVGLEKFDSKILDNLPNLKVISKYGVGLNNINLDELNKKNTELKNKFKEVAKLVNNKIFIFTKESKENGDLYGSIKPKEITNLISDKVKAEISPSQIILKDELNKIGTFKVDINFHSEVKAKISIKIDKIQSK